MDGEAKGEDLRCRAMCPVLAPEDSGVTSIRPMPAHHGDLVLGLVCILRPRGFSLPLGRASRALILKPDLHS